MISRMSCRVSLSIGEQSIFRKAIFIRLSPSKRVHRPSGLQSRRLPARGDSSRAADVAAGPPQVLFREKFVGTRGEYMLYY
jgi:hypothetical protein